MVKPWDGLVPAEDIASMEHRGRPVDRVPDFGERPALVVVDMTRAFVHDGYPTNCNAWGGAAATAGCARVLESARRHAVPVFFTKVLENGAGLHATGVELGRMRMSDPSMLATPLGLPDSNEIAEELQPIDGEVVMGKPKPSAFFGTPLQAYLTYLGTDTVVVIGMVTSGCVRATVIDAYMGNYHVIVPHECLADYSWFQHRASLFDMHLKYADVCEIEEVETFLSRTGR